MRGVHLGRVLACLASLGLGLGSGCEFPECGTESDPNKYPGGYCMQTGNQNTAGSSASKPTPLATSPQQALIGFRPHLLDGRLAPAWLMSNNVATFDIDAMVDGTGPNDRWHWETDGNVAIFEENGVTGQFQDVLQLAAPPRDQRFDGLFELVDYDGSSQLLRFGRDGSLRVCDPRGAQLHEQYKINGFIFSWMRDSGATETHTILYDPDDASSLWIGSSQLVQTRSALCGS